MTRGECASGVVQRGTVIVLEVYEWKRRFYARLREYQERKGRA